MVKRTNSKMNLGFTLMEALVYTAVLCVIMTVIISFLFWAMRSNNKSGAMREVLDNVQKITDVMSYEIKEAKGIYDPTTTSTQLSLETVKYLSDGEESSYIDFYSASSTVFLKKESQPPIALNTDKVELKNLVFTIISATDTYPSVRINLSLSYKNPNNRQDLAAELAVTTTVSMRNY